MTFLDLIIKESLLTVGHEINQMECTVCCTDIIMI